MDNKKYNVTITQTQTTDSLVAALAKLFKIPPAKAEKILSKDSFIIKKQTNKATAEKFHKAISAIGINCQIDEIVDAKAEEITPEIEATKEDTALPEIKEVKATDEGLPLIDITQPDITPLHSEHANLTLADGPKENPDRKDKIKPIDNVDPANFCPECGTIRASAISTCIHCGYDPVEISQSNMKSRLIKIAVALLIVVIGLVIANPYYQQYTKRLQLQNDLKLAFDTRNRVTDFIQQTNFWPNQNIDAGLDKRITNQSIKSVTVGNNAVITVVIYAQALEGEEQTLIFTPNILKGHIVWNCLSGNLQEAYRPELCRARPITE